MLNFDYTILLFVIIIIVCKLNSAQDVTNKTTSKPDKRGGRIIHGFKCSTSEHKFMVLVLERSLNDWMRLCGGALIRPRWVLTAAHCIRDVNYEFAVVISMNTNPKTIRATRNIVHPNYNQETFQNDIALLKLEAALSREKNDISFVDLPDKIKHSVGNTNKPICDTALVMGWGVMENNAIADLKHLQCANIPMIPFNKCKQLLSKHHGLSLYPGQVCTLSTEGIDACQGDSGGPLLCGSTQIGIVSWGIECAIPTNPGVYTEVLKYMNFILDTVGDDSKQANEKVRTNTISSDSTCHLCNPIFGAITIVWLMM